MLVSDVVWWTSIVVVVLATVLLAVIAAHASGGGELKLDSYFQLPARLYHVSAVALSPSAGGVGVLSGQVSFPRPRLGFVLVAAAILAVIAGWWLFILHQLRRLVSSLHRGDTFARENPVRLARIGAGVIGFELMHSAAVWAGTVYLKHALIVRGLRVRSHFGLDVPVLLLGLLVLTLAGAFGVGTELAEEHALTV